MHNFGINPRSVQLKISTCARYHKAEYFTYVHLHMYHEMGSFLCIIYIVDSKIAFISYCCLRSYMAHCVSQGNKKNFFKMSYFIKNVMQIGTALCNLSSLVYLNFLLRVYKPFCCCVFGKAIFQIIFLHRYMSKRDLLMLTICSS